jgi:hypothetical protein
MAGPKAILALKVRSLKATIKIRPAEIADIAVRKLIRVVKVLGRKNRARIASSFTSPAPKRASRSKGEIATHISKVKNCRFEPEILARSRNPVAPNNNDLFEIL